MKFRVRLLGTGPSQGVPSLGGADEAGDWGACDPLDPRNRRFRSSALITAGDGTRLLIDPGPDIRAQLLAAGVARLDGVLVTHSHADHVLGLDEMRAVNRVIGRELPLFATAETLESLRMRFDYCFLPPTRGFYRPCLAAETVAPGDMLTIGGLRLTIFEQDHHVMTTLGLRVGDFAYCTDVVRLPQGSLAALAGIDTWVVDCFQRQPHPVHAHLGQVLDWVTRLRPRRTILTHMSNGLDHEALAAELPTGIEPGVDGMELSF